MTSEQKLHSLLLELFDGPSLVAFVRLGPDGQRLAAHLPTPPNTLVDLASAVVSIMQRFGCLDTFFERLRCEYPLRAQRIDEVAREFFPCRSRRTVIIELDEDMDSFTPEVLERLLEGLRRLARDPSLGIRRISAGSVIVEVDTSEKGAQALLSQSISELSKHLSRKVMRLYDPSIKHKVASQTKPPIGKGAMQSMGDEQLVAMVANGESLAVEVLLGRYRPKVFEFFRRRLPPSDADELTQRVLEALSALPNRAENLRGTFRSFVFGVARNTLRNYCSRKASDRTFDPDVDSLTSLDPSLSGQFSKINSMSRLDLAIETLPLDAQMLLELRYEQGLRYREIASIYEEPELMIRRRMQLLKRKLRVMLQQFEKKG